MLQFIYFNGNTYFPVIPIATSALELANAAGKVAQLSFEQNTSFNIHSTDGSDDITITFHNSGPAIGANSTMTVVGWFTGSQGADGMDGSDGAAGGIGPVGPAGSGTTIQVQDEDDPITGGVETLKVVGANAEVEVQGSVATLTVSGSSTPTPTTHALYVGWSIDDTPEDAEFTANSDTHEVEIPAAVGSQYLIVWRSDADGGDPSEVHISGAGNSRNNFGSATAYMLNGVEGQTIVSTTTQNASLLSGEIMRVV